MSTSSTQQIPPNRAPKLHVAVDKTEVERHAHPSPLFHEDTHLAGDEMVWGTSSKNLGVHPKMLIYSGWYKNAMVWCMVWVWARMGRMAGGWRECGPRCR
jgi:hypothetical protein